MARGGSRQMCLLSQPSLTRTVRRFTYLPTGSSLASVGLARWRCPTSRLRCVSHGALGWLTAAAVAPVSPAGVAGAMGPHPGFAEVRNRNRRLCVMLLGRAPSACSSEQDQRARCKRSSGDRGSHTILRGANCSPAAPATEWGGWIQVKLQLSRVALGSAVMLSLVGGSLLTTSEAMAQCGAGVDKKGEPVAAPAAVMITGGTITNETVIDISANAGTSISDASGGNNNLATTGGGGGDGTDTASSGNGVVATSSADGGAVSIQDINSGGNVGNAISVGDTTCAPYTPPAPAPEKPKDVPVAPAPEKVVVALPDTGVGIGDASALFALITSAGAAAA